MTVNGWIQIGLLALNQRECSSTGETRYSAISFVAQHIRHHIDIRFVVINDSNQVATHR